MVTLRMLSCMVVLSVVGPLGAPAEPIDYVPFGRLVGWTGETPETMEPFDLATDDDGWTAAQLEDGTYYAGIEWDEPRPIRTVEIGFAAAIADRTRIEVQYFQNHWPNTDRGGWARLDDPFHGRWVTAKGRLVAGDRDISLRFLPYNEEQPGDDAPTMSYRRTYRVRILIGKHEPPRIKRIRAYSAGEAREGELQVRFDNKAGDYRRGRVEVFNGKLLSVTPAGLLEADDEPAFGTWQLTESGDHRVTLKLRYVAGDLESAGRTIVTVDPGADGTRRFSFLAAEVLEGDPIVAPDLGVKVCRDKAHLSGYVPTLSRLRGRSVYDRVPTEPEQTFERARREIPELRKTAQRPRPMYLPLGLPGYRQEIAVNYNGDIYLSQSALKVPGRENARMHWPAGDWYLRIYSDDPPFGRREEGRVKQRLLDDTLPIVICEWDSPGDRAFHYEQTSAVTLLEDEQSDSSSMTGDETHVLLSRIRITNSKASPATATLHFAIDPGEVLAVDGSLIRATGRINQEKVEAYRDAWIRGMLDTGGRGTLAVGPLAGGHRNDAVHYRVELAAGASHDVVLKVPFITVNDGPETDLPLTDVRPVKGLLAGLKFNDVLAREAERWRRIIAQAVQIDIPEKLLADFYKAQLCHILITADRDPTGGAYVLPAATYGYGVCMNESCHQIRALDLRGLHSRAERFLETFVRYQGTRGLDGRFAGAEGVYHGLAVAKDVDYQRFNYNLDHGFVLWMLNEHYRLTRDRAWLRRVAPSLIKACDFVTRERAAAASKNTLRPSDTSWGAGLLPPGHLEDPPEWLWWYAVNAYAYRGMRMTGESLAEIGHPDADRIKSDAAAFGEDLRRTCRESMARSPLVRLGDGTSVPHQPTRCRLRGRDVGWIRDALYGPVHLIDCGVYGHDDLEATWILKDAEDNVFIGEARGRAIDDVEKLWFSQGGITLQSNLLPNPLVYLRRGQPEHAIRAFYNSLAANVYADVRTFCEHPIRAYGVGAGPFFKTPDESAFIVWLRHLLVLENGDVLELMAGAPRAWLGDGKTVAVRSAPTYFGPISFKATSRVASGRVEIDLQGPTRNPPQSIRVHLRTPGKRAIREVTVNGRPHRDFDPDRCVVRLPGDVGKVRLVAGF